MSIPFGVHIPFVANLGFSLEKFEDGTSELHYSPRPEHHNSFDITHGGAVMTLLDVVMATAARSVEQDMGVVTIDCLLYTSPSPRDRQKSRMPSSA